jgi:ATP-binding cassette subfamily C protein
VNHFSGFLRTVIQIARWRLAVALLLMIAVGLTAGAAILVLLPLVQASGIAFGAGEESGRDFVPALLRAANRPLPLEIALAAFVAITALHGLVNWAQSRMTVSVTQGVILALRRRIMAALYDTAWVVYARTRSSDAIEALLRSTERVGYATHDLLLLITGAFTASVYITLALAVSVPVTLLVCSAGGVLMLLLRGRRRAALRLGTSLTAMDQRLYRLVSESLAGMKITRSYGAEARHRADFDAAMHDARRLHLQLAGSPALVRFYFDAGSAVVLAAATYLAIRQLAMAPAYLLVLLVVFLRLVPWLSSMQVYTQSLRAEIPAYGRVMAFERELRASAQAATSSPLPIAPLTREVRVEGVSFGYGERPVVHDIDLRIPAGRTIALVGSSGAGKTTIGDLVLGLVQPASGRILIDGIELTPDRTAAWRAQVGYVPQDAFLFHDTIRRNLQWAAPAATEAQLQEALRSAGADFVHALPDGLDTIVGDRGGLLSGGERQRLALARAFLRAPRLLVLDEATSSLDSDSENVIQSALARVHGRVAVFLIAHRLVTARRADIVYVLEEGRIVEQGSWEELLARPGGRFRALCAAQGLEPAGFDARLNPIPAGAWHG